MRYKGAISVIHPHTKRDTPRSFFQIDIGNRKVDELEGRMWAEQNGYHYFETSAHTGKNVDELFKVGDAAIL